MDVLLVAALAFAISQIVLDKTGIFDCLDGVKPLLLVFVAFGALLMVGILSALLMWGPFPVVAATVFASTLITRRYRAFFEELER